MTPRRPAVERSDHVLSGAVRSCAPDRGHPPPLDEGAVSVDPRRIGAAPRRGGARWGSGMAQVTLGIGSSHSPMLSTPHEAFAGLRELDRARLPEVAAQVRESAAWIGRELEAEVTRDC